MTAKAGPHFLMFEFNGRRYAIPMQDPSHPPAAPHGAVNLRMAIHNPVRDDELESRRDEPRPEPRTEPDEPTPIGKVLPFGYPQAKETK